MNQRDLIFPLGRANNSTDGEDTLFIPSNIYLIFRSLVSKSKCVGCGDLSGKPIVSVYMNGPSKDDQTYVNNISLSMMRLT